MANRFTDIIIGARVLLIGAAIAASMPGAATAGFTDSESDLTFAISALRTAIGNHPRVLKIEVDPDSVTIEAQDPKNPSHIDEWRYGVITLVHVLPLKRLTGPTPVDPTLINPDIEANLFDLDSVDFSAFDTLSVAAIKRARLQDAAAITRIEIARQVYILPKPSSGDVRWTLQVDSGRERAEIFANLRGDIIGSDLSGTQRARTLNLLADTELLTDAAVAARATLGSGAVLTKVGIDPKTVSFATNIRDNSMSRLMGGNLPSTASFTWDLDGMRQRLGNISFDTQTGAPPAAAFAVDDLDWTIFAKLEKDALAKVAIARAAVTRVEAEKSNDLPGGAALIWTVGVTEPSGEVTNVVADTKGQIMRVILPESRRPKTDWLAPVTLANAIKRIGPTFGANVKIASIVMDDRGGRITIDDPANSGKASTFDFTADSVSRSAISFSLDSMGPRFGLADIASLDETKIGTIETLAREKITRGKPAWLESITIGAHPFVRSAGAKAIEVRYRDIEVDSVKAEYAWIVFDLNGRVLDFVTF